MPSTRAFTLQSNESDCGAASLHAVLAQLGVESSTSDVRTACRVGLDGCTAADIVRGAAAFGVAARGRRMTLDDLATLRTPAIVSRDEHFVVVEEVSAGSVSIADPARGRTTLATSEFGRGFSGVALTFTLPASAASTAPRTTAPRRTTPDVGLSVGRLAILAMFGILWAVSVVVLAASVASAASSGLRPAAFGLASALTMGLLSLAARRTTASRSSVASAEALAGWLGHTSEHAPAVIIGRARQYAAAVAGLQDRVSDAIFTGTGVVCVTAVLLVSHHLADIVVAVGVILSVLTTAVSSVRSDVSRAAVAHGMAQRIAVSADHSRVDVAELSAAAEADADARSIADGRAYSFGVIGHASTAVVLGALLLIAARSLDTGSDIIFASATAPFVLTYTRRAVTQAFQVRSALSLMTAFGTVPSSSTDATPRRRATHHTLELTEIGCTAVETKIRSTYVALGSVLDIDVAGARTILHSMYSGIGLTGALRVGGSPVTSLSEHRSAVILVSDPSLFDGTVRDNVTLFDNSVIDDELAALAAPFELDRIGWSTDASRLDLLDRRLIGLARCALFGAGPVLADEPYAGLTPDGRDRVRAAMQALGVPVVTASQVGAR